MKLCPYCSHSNPDNATQCRKCDASFLPQRATLYKAYWCSPEKARALRNKALAAIVLGLLMKVYWGGYGPWPVIDTAPWARIRPIVEPWLLYGGAVAYAMGWILNWI